METTLTTMLTWTTLPPTRGGFYWARLPETPRPQIVWIHNVELAGHPPLLLVFPAGMDAAYPPNRVAAWAGPIPEPEAPLQELAPTRRWPAIPGDPTFDPDMSELTRTRRS